MIILSRNNRSQLLIIISYRACALLLILAVLSSNAAAETESTGDSDAATTIGDVLVPPEVAYKPASPEANDARRKKLQQLFSFVSPADEVTELIGATPTIIGAPLWQKMLQDSPDVRDTLKTGKVHLMVPKLDNDGKVQSMQQMEATVIRSSAEALSFWKELEKLIRKTADTSTSPTVRKLTASEPSLYWTMIPFDIEEPIFIVEVGDHHILVNTPGKQRSAIWIDDLKGLRFMNQLDGTGASTASKALLDQPETFVDPTTGREMSAVWEESEPQTAVPDKQTSEGISKLDHVRLLTPAEVIERNVPVENLVKVSDWADQCLEKLPEEYGVEHKISVVVVFSADSKPEYRVAVDPVISGAGLTKLKETLAQGPDVRSKTDTFEVLFAFLVGK